jgi:drug/metabolite transporter (DMT)-like permease
MTFDPSVLGLVLLAAFLHACWNTIVKTGRDGLVMFALIKVPTVVVGLLVLAFVGIPSMESIPYAICSAIGFTGYCFVLIWAYRVGDLNLIYPVARGSAPLIVALLSSLCLDEQLSGLGLAGILIISLGIAAFAYHPHALTRYVPDLLRAAGVGLCIASYTLLDGAGARVSQNVLGYTALATVFSGIPLITVTVALRGRDLTAALRRDWKVGLLGGVMMYATYAIVIYAMTRTQVTHVAALRETSIIFAAIIGAMVLKEPMGIRRTVTATVVAAGIIMVTLSGV